MKSYADAPRRAQERAELAQDLIASLDIDRDAVTDPDSVDVEGAWLAEVEHRLVGVERGTASFEPWETVEERIATRLHDMRR